MHEVEQELYKLGVPVKTRHNEVAPSQFELAPIFEDAGVSADHNALTMDILWRVALRHDLICLLHEKPFAGINGSGKHNNWSLATQKGENILDPGKTPHQNLRFLAVLSAVLKAVCDHSDVIRVGIASAGNDHRLGANEAPPAIISVFVGENLSRILDTIESGKIVDNPAQDAILSLGVSKLPVVSRDNTDRNRTSPFAFTGNKFEFRAVGSSANVAFPISILNAAAADAFDRLSDRLEKKLSGGGSRDEAVLSLIREVVSETKRIRFEGNNYSDEWKAEAGKRGLPILSTTPEALTVLEEPEAYRFLEEQKVLSGEEVRARYNIILERYIKQIEMEASTLLELADTHVQPAMEAELSRLAEMVGRVKAAGGKVQAGRYDRATALYERLVNADTALDKELTTALRIADEKERANALCAKVLPAMQKVREVSDEIEGFVADNLWTLPKYRELLFLR
jgi:glutamine synthetase